MGTALATPLTHNEHEVRLWGTELDVALINELRAGQPHPHLRMPVSSRVQLYEPQELATVLADVDVTALAITSEGVVSILQRAVPYLQPDRPLLMVTKGFGCDAAGRVCLLPSLLTATLPPHLRKTCPLVAVGGPYKANEVAAGWPTATVYGSVDTLAIAQCQALFQTDTYRILSIDDVIGLEVAAALKNVYAIAMGICNGLEVASKHPWHNLKAAIFPQAITEMTCLAEALGGRGDTVKGLAGAGDLEVTALSGRNRILGERLGRGEPIASALETMRIQGQTVEGVAAAGYAVELVRQLANEGRTDMTDYPLLNAIHAILAGASHLVALLSGAVLPAMGEVLPATGLKC